MRYLITVLFLICSISAGVTNAANLDYHVEAGSDHYVSFGITDGKEGFRLKSSDDFLIMGYTREAYNNFDVGAGVGFRDHTFDAVNGFASDDNKELGLALFAEYSISYFFVSAVVMQANNETTRHKVSCKHCPVETLVSEYDDIEVFGNAGLRFTF